ncbi:MAG: endospore germination permease [Eubacteriales bacterium]|nr:endospore germination permease [Eubacteriales bacterium]
MNGINEKIKASQLTFLIISFIQGSVLLISLVDDITKQDSWMSMVSGFVVSVPFILSYAFLAKRFPGKNLIEINDIIYGNTIGKIVSIFYLLFFLLLLAFNFGDIADFFNGYIMPETPKMVFIVVFALICAFAVKRGIAAIAKASLLTAIFTIAAVIFTTILLIGEMDFSNFQPMFESSAKEYLQVSHIMFCLPFGEIIALLMITQHMKNDKKLPRTMVWGTGISALIFLAIVVRDTAVLGASITIFSETSYQAVRMIDIGEFLTRIELLVALNYTASLFIKICVLYFVTVTGVSQLVRAKSSTPLILSLGSIVIVLAMVSFGSTIYRNEWGYKYAALFATPFTAILPPLSLLIAKIRKLPNTGGVRQ